MTNTNKPLDGWLFASDIDNTLVSNGHINSRSIEAIQRFSSLGGKVTLASGRIAASAIDVAKAIGVNCPIIASNGAIIYDTVTELVLESMVLPEHSKPFAHDILKKFDRLGALAYCETEVLLIKENQTILNLIEYEDLKIIKSDNPDSIPWSKIIFGAEPEYVDGVEQKYNSITDYGNFIRSMDKFYELMPHGVNKGAALLKLAGMLDIDRSKICAVGDYYNDVEFVRNAAYGAFVENAPDELKQTAYFVGGNCSDGGVADFIEHIIDIATK